jgi:antitoxin component YwqK of YwqJK toxin-antitoxin module
MVKQNNGTVYKCGYKNGEKNGVEREYGDDGRLVSETFYVNGTADGPFAVLSFYTSGSADVRPFTILKSIGRHVRGKYDGLIEHYTDGMISETEIYSGGKKLRTTLWHNGIRHGKDTCYDTLENPLRIAAYNRGEISRIKKSEDVKLGPEYDYDSYPGNDAYKKTLPLESCYAASYYSIDNILDSINNETETEYWIKDGTADGSRKHYYRNNRIETDVIYKSGRAFGTAREYYYSGALFSETVYVNGEKNGPAKYYEDRPISLRILNWLIPQGEPAKVLHFFEGIQAGALGKKAASDPA